MSRLSASGAEVMECSDNAWRADFLPGLRRYAETMGTAPRRNARLAALRVAVAAVALAGTAIAAHAQLRVPGGLPRLPGLPDVVRAPPLNPDAWPGGVPLQELRRGLAEDLLRRHAGEVERDPRGEPIVRAELVLLSPSGVTLDAARNQGYVVLREDVLEGLGERTVVLRAPRGGSTAEALRRLQALDPKLEVDFNHLYLPGGEVGVRDAGDRAASSVASAPLRRVGLVDGGIDAGHPALARITIVSFGCHGAAEAAFASPHGTAVASLLVGADGTFQGIAPEATLFAADVYCGRAVGGSVEAVVAAFAWLARERIGVVNVSLVGPPNRVLERAVRTLLERGHVVVAAVGNDGPAAPPLYPASYPGVIGVSGVNTERRVLPEAAQGQQVMFTAPGADLAAARSGARGYVAVRGTSFAAPLVAGLLAQSLPEPDRAAAARALQSLVEMAVDLGAPGRDPVFGHGLVGEWARIEPARVHAASSDRVLH